MDLKEIKVLIDLMRKNDLSVFKMEKEGFKITLKKGNDFQPVTNHFAAPLATSQAVLPVGETALSTGAGVSGLTLSGAASAKEITSAREIVSPMVGTFYTSASPDSPVYVEVGQEVTENTVVCIIEAMKVMNEIKAEIAGVIAEILVENGKPVQFGQPLFRLR